MNQVFTCAPRAAATDHGHAVRVRRNGRSAVIDIHCHIAVPAADALIRGREEAMTRPPSFSSPASDAVNRAQFRDIATRLTGVEERLADMDRLGVDIQAISPSPGHYYYWAPPDAAREACRVVNDGVAEAVGGHPDRFVGMGTVPLQAPELAIAEMRRCVKDLGFRGIEICTNVAGRELSEADFRPFFAAAEELGVLIFMHPLGFTHGQRLTQHYFNNVIGNPLESTLAVSHLIFGGVLERHPGLKLCIAHGGGYLPAYFGRMDHAWRARADCREHISRPPSDYLRRIYFDTLVHDRRQLEFMVKTWGAEHLCMGTDYPFDMGEPDPVGFHDQLSKADRDRILGGTAAELLGLAVTRISEIA
ncbi:MAG: amidohydrolase family protein [Caulobacterales bacterium]